MMKRVEMGDREAKTWQKFDVLIGASQKLCAKPRQGPPAS
jgi:hypothetical protein